MSSKEKTTKIQETKYSRSEIIGAASSFGVMPELLAGALSLVKGDEFTRKEVEKAIDSFKKRKVK